MSPPAPRRSIASLRPVAFAALALLVAVLLDRAIIEWAAPHRQFVKANVVFQAFKKLGEFGVTFCVAVLLAALHAWRWRAAVMVIVSGLIGGGFELVLKWTVGRSRPIADGVVDLHPFRFDMFRGGWAGIGDQRNLCFPSGHTLLAFSTAACLVYLCPRGRWIWFVAATLVAINRVGEIAHYPSDVVAAAILGMVSSVLAMRLTRLPELARASPDTDGS